MSLTLEKFGIDRLNTQQRLELIDLIWDSLPEQVEPGEIAPEHLHELALRRQAADERPGEGRPWREVLQDLDGTR